MAAWRLVPLVGLVLGSAFLASLCSWPGMGVIYLARGGVRVPQQAVNSEACFLEDRPSDARHFANESVESAPASIRPILRKIVAKPALSHADVFVVSYALLPPSSHDDWPSVAVPAPVPIAETLGFNSEFHRDWYFFNMNGYLADGRRFYVLRQLYRWGTKYMQGVEGRAWLFFDVISFFAVDKDGVVTTVREVESGPMYLAGAAPKHLSENAYVLEKYPLRLSKGNLTLLSLDNGTLHTTFRNSKFALDMECTCLKGVLLQGKNLNGLDPGSSQFIAKSTGATYQYYSWPRWKLQAGEVSVSGVTTIQMDAKRAWNFWLDHQGGTVKSPPNALLGQLTVMLGLRPSISPGWNWFSVQFFNGEEFTGFSNKPWKNDVKFNRQQLQGTWDERDGRIHWMFGELTILDFWTSPISGTHFGIEYLFDLGLKGTFRLKAIVPDQRVSQWGIENYEGGADVFSYPDGEFVGLANIECVGWPNATARVDFALRTVGVTDLTASEKNALATAMATDVRPASLLVVVLCMLSLIVFAVFFIGVLVYSGWSKPAACIVGTTVASVSASVSWLTLLVAAKVVGCAISHSCAVDKLNFCLFTCPT